MVVLLLFEELRATLGLGGLGVALVWLCEPSQDVIVRTKVDKTSPS